MYAGAASGAVTIGLALFLIMMSQKPNASETLTQPPPETVAVENPVTNKQPPQTAVVLPPPPALAVPEPPTTANAPPNSSPATAPAPPRIQRKPLTPRTVEMPVKTVDVTPLKPRPQPAPQKAAPTPEPPLVAEPVTESKKAPPEGVARLPDAKPSATPAAQSTPLTITQKSVKEGRALLKMLEIGRGPVIEVVWPQKSADRSRLYRLLTSCHGMKTALLTDNRRLFTADTAPGQSWNVNRDAVSGFIRKPSGVLTDTERAVIRRIKVRHGLETGDAVRLFPRGVDAVMLGGLGQIVGPGYLKYKTIRARYALVGDRITVNDVRVDGSARPGRIALPKINRCIG